MCTTNPSACAACGEIHFGGAGWPAGRLQPCCVRSNTTMQQWVRASSAICCLQRFFCIKQHATPGMPTQEAWCVNGGRERAWIGLGWNRTTPTLQASCVCVLYRRCEEFCCGFGSLGQATLVISGAATQRLHPPSMQLNPPDAQQCCCCTGSSACTYAWSSCAGCPCTGVCITNAMRAIVCMYQSNGRCACARAPRQARGCMRP